MLSFLLPTAKNFFRVSYRSGGQLQSHYFQASDAFNKQQWINCIRQAKEAAALTGDQPPQTGQCLQTGPSGQIRPLSEAAVSLQSDSGIEDEKGMWGGVETGLNMEGKESLSGGKFLSLGKGALDGGAGLELDGETRMDSETRLTISETEAGEIEAGRGVSETGAQPGARADWRTDGGGGGGGTLSRGAKEEQEVMEQEQSGAKEEGEVSMDTSEPDSLQGGELSLRC